eukprot:g15223.t1
MPSKSKVKRLRERDETALDADLCHYLQEHRVGRAKSKEQKRQQWLETTQRNYAPPFLHQLRPRMWHIGSALTVSALPAPRLPEVAFCGRSNCGKSTLMNHLCGWGKAYGSKNCIARRIAFRRTTELNFYNVGKPSLLRFVDLPGYGFASASVEQRTRWTEFSLCKYRKTLKLVLVLLDARLGFLDSDREFLGFLERNKVRWQVVLTKADLVPRKELTMRIQMIQKHEIGSTTSAQYSCMHSPPIPISGLKHQNLESLRSVVEKFALNEQVVVDGMKQNIYDLVELQRIRRVQKQGRRKTRLKEKQRAKEMEVGAKNLASTLARWGLSEEEEGEEVAERGGEGGAAEGGGDEQLYSAAVNGREEQHEADRPDAGEDHADGLSLGPESGSSSREAADAQQSADACSAGNGELRGSHFPPVQLQPAVRVVTPDVAAAAPPNGSCDHSVSSSSNPVSTKSPYFDDDASPYFDDASRLRQKLVAEKAAPSTVRSSSSRCRNSADASGELLDPLSGLPGVVSFDMSVGGGLNLLSNLSYSDSKRSRSLMPNLDETRVADKIAAQLEHEARDFSRKHQKGKPEKLSPQSLGGRVGPAAVGEANVLTEAELNLVADRVQHTSVREDDEEQNHFERDGTSGELTADEKQVAFRSMPGGKNKGRAGKFSLQEEMRRRHTMEWRTALVAGVADANGANASPSSSASPSQGPTSAEVAGEGKKATALLGATTRSPPRVVLPGASNAAKTTPVDRIGLFTPLGVELPKGIQKWKYVGKPSPKHPALMKQRVDVASVLRLQGKGAGDADHVKLDRKTGQIKEKVDKKSGNALTFEEGREKMVRWIAKNRKRPDLLAEAGSIKKADLERDFLETNRKRLGGSVESMEDLRKIDTNIPKEADPLLNKEVRALGRGLRRKNLMTKKTRHPGTAATSHTLGTRQRLRLFRRYLQRGILASSFAYLVMEAHNFLYDEMMCLDRGGRGAAEAALCYLREEDARAAVQEGGEATAISKEAEADTGSICIANRRRDRLRRQAEWAVSREDVDAARTGKGDAGRAAASGNGSGSEQPVRRSLIEELDHDSAVQRWRERLFARARGAVLELGASSTTAWRNLEVYSRPKYNSRNDHSGSVTKVCACDIDARGLAELERRVLAAGALKVGLTFVAGDAESRLPFPDASFDTVTMSFLLSFVTDPVRVLDEATRVLKKNGRILLLERGASAYGLVRGARN